MTKQTPWYDKSRGNIDNRIALVAVGPLHDVIHPNDVIYLLQAHDAAVKQIERMVSEREEIRDASGFIDSYERINEILDREHND